MLKRRRLTLSGASQWTCDLPASVAKAFANVLRNENGASRTLPYLRALATDTSHSSTIDEARIRGLEREVQATVAENLENGGLSAGPSAEPSTTSTLGSGVSRAAAVATAAADRLEYDSQSIRLTRHPTVNKVSSLKHGLSRVIKEPGPHWLQDPKTGRWNYPRQIAEIPSTERVDEARVQFFLRPSADTQLHKVARAAGCQFTGSSSSLTGCLLRLIKLFGGQHIRQSEGQSSNYTKTIIGQEGQRLDVIPVGGVMAIDAAKIEPMARLAAATEKHATPIPEDHLERLRDAGHIVEQMITTTAGQWKQWLPELRPTSYTPPPMALAYTYSSVGKLMMRNQLDACLGDDPDFWLDIKARATRGARSDPLHRPSGENYRIHALEGPAHSFSDEILGMQRWAYSKWNVQVRMGGMKGLIAVLHNLRGISGFQFVPLEAMDKFSYGSTANGEAAFSIASNMMSDILTRLADHYHGTRFRVSFYRDMQAELRQQLHVVAWQPADGDGVALNPLALTLHRDQTTVGSTSWTTSCRVEENDDRSTRALLQADLEILEQATPRPLVLPDELIKRLTASDREQIARHNATPGIKGVITTIRNNTYPLLPGYAYETIVPSFIKALRRSTTASGQ